MKTNFQYISNKRKALIRIILLMIFLFPILVKTHAQVYTDSTAKITDRVNDLIGRMTIDEKIGQMLQDERGNSSTGSWIKSLFLGSVLSGGGSTPSDNSPKGWVSMYNQFQDSAMATRLKIPIIYGIDAVHGHNNAYGAIIFPHNIGMGCTHDSDLLTECTRITAIEVRATGLNWTFSPCITVPRDICWGRTYEGFGETPELQKTMAKAAVKGYQGDSLGTPGHILACAKHYLGDGGTTNGINEGNTQISETLLRQIHLPGYIKAIEAGVGSIMVSYSSWNGVYCHANKYLVTDVLKTELGFSGFVVSDWHGSDYVSSDYETSIETSVNAGIDMFMEPNSSDQVISYLKDLVNKGKVSESRIDDAVKRILTVKFKLGLFEHPYANLSLADSFGNDYHRSIARRAVRESQVLLTNKNNFIPLSKTAKILVAGTKANDIGSQCGGWTLTWQGQTGNVIPGTTILDAIKKVCGSQNVNYSADGSGTSSADLAVVVIGETPYAEGAGDNLSLGLGFNDLNVISNIQKLNIPYVIILLSGRPLMMESVINNANAFIASWLPGTEAEGITDVLFGDYLFTGKLSHTWPTTISQVQINYGDNPYSPLFPYGYGLVGNEPLNIAAIKSNLYVSLYPNPAKDKISIMGIQSQNINVSIYNSMGELVMQKQITNSKEVDISSLSNGIYIMRILNSNSYLNYKFIKE
jgi:beta-glucosidase